MKEIKNLYYFKKIIRKYWKRHAKRSSFFHEGKKITSWWVAEPWCYYILKSFEYDDPKVKELFSYELHPEYRTKILEKIKQISHSKIIIENQELLFLGPAVTNNGAILVFEDNEKRYLKYFNVNLLGLDYSGESLIDV